MVFAMKTWRIILAFFIALVALIVLLFGALALPNPFAVPVVHGVTFSQPFAESIGLDWRETYDAVLDDLGVKRLRLVAYWDVIEPIDGEYDFSDLDYQMDSALAHDASVILAIGRKVPRWPECYVPKWATGLSEQEQQERVLEMLEVVVDRYKGHGALVMWQVENEPFLVFGECPPEDREFFSREEQLVGLLDPDHPILVTDSGELNSWLLSSQYGDVLGSTMYRTVFSGRTGRTFRYDYIFPSWLYRLKARYVGVLRGKNVIVSELQGEPWGASRFIDMSDEERMDLFSTDRFRQMKRFVERTQFAESYWWGVEYWYWEKEHVGNGAYWAFAKSLFNED